MKRFVFSLGLVAVLALSAQAATINVPADQATIQAAIDAAADGDTIIVADGTYTEDLLFLGNASLNKDNITLQGSAPGNVIIEAANTRTNGPGLNAGVLGIIGQQLGAGAAADHKGIMVEGDGITLRNLTIRNNSTTGDALFGESAAVLVSGDNCTIDNCIIECDPGNDAGRAIYVITGDYNGFNPAFGGAGYADPMTALNLTVTDTALTYGDGTFDTVDAAFYIAVFLAMTPPAPVVGSGSFTDCEFSKGGNLLEIDGGTYSFNNCTFRDFGKGAEIGGGTWNFNDCLFTGGQGSEYMDIDWTGEGGPTQSTVNLNNCVLCGSTGGAPMIHASECDFTASSTIFNVTEGAAHNKPVIRYSPGDYDSDWTLFGGYPAGGSSVTLDQCDVHTPFGPGILGNDPQIPGEPVGDLVVTNTIFISTDPINLTGPTGSAARNATVDNNNLYSTGAVGNPDGGWVIVSETDNLNVLPGYLDPVSCPTPENAGLYVYTNQTLATAGTSGGPLGSQGVQGDPPSSIENWNLY